MDNKYITGELHLIILNISRRIPIRRGGSHQLQNPERQRSVPENIREEKHYEEDSDMESHSVFNESVHGCGNGSV